MKHGWLLFLFSILAMSAIAQRTAKSADISLALGKDQGSLSLLFIHDWKLGARHRFGIGVGGRISSYYGVNQYYSTAPSALTSESTSPLIIFKQNINTNIDTLLVKSSFVTAANLTINLDYQLSARLSFGFNIDAVGVSFGHMAHGNYINGPYGKNTTARPTAFNLLLVSDNDKGSLNSELYVKYLLSQRWSLKGAAQFLFTEYKTSTPVQQYPQPNDRFRNKSLMADIGVSYYFK